MNTRTCTLVTIGIALMSCTAHAQSCHDRSYSRTYSTYSYPSYSYSTPSYSYVPSYAYSTPHKTYAVPAKKDYDVPTYFRFLLAFPVVELPSYGAAYQEPALPNQASPNNPFLKGANGAPTQAQVQQDSAFQQVVLNKLDLLDKGLKDVGSRVEKLERSRGPVPLQNPQPKEQTPQKDDPVAASVEVSRAFAEVDAKSCAACHRRGNEKHGGNFVFSEADGKMARLTADQREEVQRQLVRGKMPRLNSPRAKEANVQALTKEAADIIFKQLDQQIQESGK